MNKFVFNLTIEKLSYFTLNRTYLLKILLDKLKFHRNNLTEIKIKRKNSNNRAKYQINPKFEFTLDSSYFRR